MKKFLMNVISLLLAVIMCSSSFSAFAKEFSSVDEAEIESTTMSLEGAKNNAEDYYYTNKEWAEEYPEGLFVVEYNSYGIYEGGSDPENPQDVYLGIVVYRIGGNSQASDVTYTLTGISADDELYPDSMGLIEFEPQQTTATAKIKITNDDVRNGDQMLMFALVDATTGVLSDAASAVITITDDEPYVQSVVRISTDAAVYDKNKGTVPVRVTRSKNDTDYCSLMIKTSDGTAKAGVDYEAVEKEIFFLPDQTEQIVWIPLVQSEDSFTDSKYFTVTMTDLKGCEAQGESTIRVDITNERKNKGTEITMIESSADLEISNEDALTDSSYSVINTNDTVDRKELLLAAVGAVNGTAVQSVPKGEIVSLSADAKWTDIQTVTPSEFQNRYSSGDKWVSNKEFTDANENTVIESIHTYDLNLYESMEISFKNKENLKNGKPNTAFGYMPFNSSFGKNSSSFSYIKSQLSNCSSDDLQWMKNNDVYILVNRYACNDDYSDNPLSVGLKDSQANRYIKTTGYDGSNQKLFYMIYNINNQGDDTHFTMYDTKLHRAVVPFSVFNQNDKFECSTNSVSFVKDGYKWTLEIQDNTKGGVGIADIYATANEDKYGFYVGSTVNVRFSIAEGTSTANVPIPDALKLTDEKGNVHNVGTRTQSGSFAVPLQTIMSKDNSALQAQYGLTSQEAKNHIDNTLGEGQSISVSYNGKLTLQAEFSIRQGIVVDYVNVPVLVAESGGSESDFAHKERIKDGLRGIVTFYDEKGNDITPEPADVNLDETDLVYPDIEFAYIKVDPTSANHGYIVSTNLMDLDLQSFDTVTTILKSDCAQVSDKVVLTLYDNNTDYLIPQIHTQSTTVAKRTDTGFETVYNLDHLADYLAYEAIYNDTAMNPDVVYYGMYFSISDIYASGMAGGGTKSFPVTVYHENTSGTERTPLFEFTFTGGVTVPGSKNVDLNILSSDFGSKITNVDGSLPEGVDPYEPSLTLLSRSGNAYNFVLYIPTYYDYVGGATGVSSPYYTQIFYGGDGISMEMENYNDADRVQDNTSESNSDIISVLDINSTQYVATQVMQFTTESDDQSMETPYYDEQEEFSTYTDNNIIVGISGFNLDCTNLFTFLSKSFALAGDLADSNSLKNISKSMLSLSGTGFYVKFNDNDIVVGGKIAFGVGQTMPTPSGSDNTDSPEVEMDEIIDGVFQTTGGTGADSTNDVSKLKTLGNSLSKLNAGYVKLGAGANLDASVTLSYNPVTHKYVFSKFNIGVGGSASISGTIPIPATANLIYITVSTTLSASVSTGCSQVLNYVDQKGVCHYKTLWNGIPLKGGITVSVGFGVGIAGLLALEGSVTLDICASMFLAKSQYQAAQLEFDLNTNTSQSARDAAKEKYFYEVSYSGSWTTEDTKDIDGAGGGNPYKDYYFNDTKVVSTSENDTITITGKGTSFHLVGLRDTHGGKMEVTVEDAKGKVLSKSLVNTASDHLQEYYTLYTWQLDDYTDTSVSPIEFKVTIRHMASDSNEATKLELDSFRIYNSSYYQNDIVPFEFGSFTLKVGLSLKLVVGPFDFAIEPGYMIIDCTKTKQTITLGAVAWSKVYDVTVTSTADEDIPLVMASSAVRGSDTGEGYFTTGEFSSEKTKTLMAEGVLSTAGNQVLSHKSVVDGTAHIYAFYSVLKTNSTTKETRYELHYAIDGVEKGRVSDDLFVTDFFAFEDENGKLTVIYTTTDSTVTSFTGEEGGAVTVNMSDGTSVTVDKASDLKDLLKKQCVKVAVYDDNGGFNLMNIKGTADNAIQESIPIAATYPGKASVLVYAVDEQTGEQAQYNMNWTSYNEETSLSSANMADLLNSMYTGRAQLYCAVKNGANEYGTPISLDLESLIGADKFKTGFKIISLDALMTDSDTVCIAFAAEIPYVSDSKGVGTLKELYYVTGDITQSGMVLSDVLVVDSVLDYDEDLDEVFAQDNDIPSKYYNEETGELYESNILRNVQLETAVVIDEKGTVTYDDALPEPVLFYQTNESINYITFSALASALEAKKNGTDAKATVGVLYDGYFDDYVIAVEADNTIDLIYTDNTGTDYEDTLYITNFDAKHSLWNKPRQLTYSDAFDADAYEDKEETAALIFENYSVFIDENNKVAVGLKSSYVPFSYDQGITEESLGQDPPVDIEDYYDGYYLDENGNTQPMIVTPLLDYDSDKARSDIFLLTFEEKVTDVNVTGFELDNNVFSPGNTIEAGFTIVNAGDTIIEEMNASLYYYDLKNHKKVNGNLCSKKLSATFLAGDSFHDYLSYTVQDIPDDMLLCIEIKDGSGRKVLYDSYTDSYLTGDTEDLTYYEINKAAEIIFDGYSVDVDSNGVMTYNVRVGNIGTVNAESKVTVYCTAYNADEERIGTLFSFDVSKDDLEIGNSKVYTNYLNVKDYLYDGVLYYRFELYTSDAQFNTDNDTTDISKGYQIPEVSVESVTNIQSSTPIHASGHRSYSLKLGDEIRINGSVISDYYPDSEMRVYEIGTSCLSIDNSSADGSVRIKVVDLPKNGNNNIRLLLSVRGTAIYEYFYLHITNTDTLELDSTYAESGWEESTKCHLYARDYDLLSTENDGSELNFTFYGEDLKLYGNFLSQGGKFTVTVTDEKGNTVAKDTVDTKSELNDYGMLLYATDKLPFGEYKVNIKAELQEGEKIALDYARFTVDTSDADTTPYAVVNSYDEQLDAPMISGRLREANFTLNFTKDIKLSEGKNFEDITLKFDEYEKQADGTYTATGEQVVFTAKEIKDGRHLVLTSALSSKQGAVMKYVLADSNIPEGVLVTMNGIAVETAIPDYDMVSYELKESGILSVVVGDDEEMPDASVQKSVLVKFMTVPDTDRLEGTKLLYMTTDNSGAEQVVEFRYAQMTDDPRTAVYRADSLELSSDELSKVWNFSSGIVLGESNYVLVTADGDYLESDLSTVITDTSALNISYEKLKADKAPVVSVRTETSEDTLYASPAVSVTFAQAVDTEETENAYVIVKKTVTNKDGKTSVTDLTLYAKETADSGRILVFAATSAEEIPAGARVEYALVSDSIQYIDNDKPITCAYDGIAVDPALMEAKTVAFNEDAYIVNAKPYVTSDGILCVDVKFSGDVSEQSLRDTTLSVTQYTQEYDFDYSKVLTLGFDSISGTVATYKYMGDGEITLAYGDVKKTYIVENSITAENGAVTTADGVHEYSLSILSTETLNMERAKADSAEIKLVKDDEFGYNVVLSVKWDEQITQSVEGNTFATINMTRGSSDPEKLYLDLIDVTDNTLTFVTTTPITLRSSEVTTFEITERFTDAQSFIVDENGIGVSEDIIGLTELVVDNTRKGLAESVNLSFTCSGRDKVTAEALVAYDEELREQSFEKSTINAVQKIIYAQGQTAVVDVVLEFDSLADANTARYTAEFTVPSQAERIELITGESITAYGGHDLYNTDKTLALSTDLPESRKAKVARTMAEDVSMFATTEDGKIDSINDTAIIITYEDDVTVENKEGITLKVNVSGIDGIETVTYRARYMINGDTLVLSPDEKASGKYANVVELSLENASIVLEETTALYDTASGLSVCRLLPDASQVFYVNTEGVPVTTPPAGDDTVAPTDTTGDDIVVPTETRGEVTVSTETSAADSPAESATQSADTEGESENGTLTTGRDTSFIWIVSIVMVTAFAVIVLLRRKISA